MTDEDRVDGMDGKILVEVFLSGRAISQKFPNRVTTGHVCLFLQCLVPAVVESWRCYSWDIKGKENPEMEGGLMASEYKRTLSKSDYDSCFGSFIC